MMGLKESKLSEEDKILNKEISEKMLGLLLLYGNIRTQNELGKMSKDDRRNTIVAELNKHSDIKISDLQKLKDIELVGLFLADPTFALLALNVRTVDELVKMSHDDKRNTLIVELAKTTKESKDDLQKANNFELCKKVAGSIDIAKQYSKKSAFRNSLSFFSSSISNSNSKLSEANEIDSLIDNISGSKDDNQRVWAVCAFAAAELLTGGLTNGFAGFVGSRLGAAVGHSAQQVEKFLHRVLRF